MQNNIAVIIINLNSIIRRIENLFYLKMNYEVELKLKVMEEKIYELSDVLETIEVLLE